MSRYAPATRVWAALMGALAFAVSLLARQYTTVPLAAWAPLGLLGLAAAIAHHFPIKSATNQTSYRLTNVFLIAGAIVLPPGLLTPLVVLALTPDGLAAKQRSRALGVWLLNVPPTILALHAASLWLTWTDAHRLTDFRDLAAMLGAASVVTVLQTAIVGVGMAWHFRLPLWRVDTLTTPALLGDSLFGVLGVMVGGLWLAQPVLLVLLFPLLILAHRLTRTAHLARLAEVDPKTGLPNVRQFERVLAEELAQSQRLNRPLTLLFADLDHFKAVNDRYGHAAGDRALQELATLLTTTIRAHDTVARFGGEEFALLLPGVDADEALFYAERVRAAVAGHDFALADGAAVRCTVSIGVATCPADGATLAALLASADSAMYRAKQTRDAVARVQALPPFPRLPAPAAPAPTARPAPPPTPLLASLVLWGLIGAGLLAVGAGLVVVTLANRWLALLPFLALALAAEFLTVQVYEANRQKISLSFTIGVILAAAVLYPAAAPLVALAAALVHVVQKQQWRAGAGKMLFNLTNSPLAAAVAGGLYTYLQPDGARFTVWHLLAAVIAVNAYYVTNVGTIALLISLHSRRPLAQVVRDAAWFAPFHILLGVTGAFLAGAHAQLALLGSVMFVVPVLLMRFTLAFYARRSQRAIETLEAAKTEVEQAHLEKEATLQQLIETVGAIIDARDNAVAGHSQRVAEYAVALGEELGLSATELAYLRTAGLLHDLGKVAVPEAILHKPAKLTAEEYEIIKQHAPTGARILGEVGPLGEVARMVGEHHERYNGSGYPAAKRGEAISVGGRILAVADTLDSILSDRPYSKGKPLAWALDEIDRCAGTLFDPAVAAALHRLVEERGPGFFWSSPQEAADAPPALELVV